VVERQPDILEDTLGRVWLSLSLLTAEGAHSVTRPWSYHWRAWLLPALLASTLHLGMLWLVIGQIQGPAFPIAQTIRVTLVNLASPKPEAPSPATEKVVQASVEPVEVPVKEVVKEVRKPVKKKAVAASQPKSAPRKPSAEPALDSMPVMQPAIPDSSPTYHAAHLNNPRPHYPNAARRRGLQGRVLLYVEVMPAGHCGHIDIKQSSGHSILDEAAVESVRQWRFVPAYHAGLAVTRWLYVPVRFELTARE